MILVWGDDVHLRGTVGEKSMSPGAASASNCARVFALHKQHQVIVACNNRQAACYLGEGAQQRYGSWIILGMLRQNTACLPNSANSQDVIIEAF